MVERIKIQSSSIETFDSSGNKTFTTAEQYVKTTSGGQFKLGGYEGVPVRVGSVDPYYTDIYPFPEEGHLYYKNLTGNTAKWNITSNIGYLPAFSFLCLQPQIIDLYSAYKDAYNAYPINSSSVYIRVDGQAVGTGYWDFYRVSSNWWYQPQINANYDAHGYACTFISTSITNPNLAGTVTIDPATVLYYNAVEALSSTEQNSFISESSIPTQHWYHRVLIDLTPTNLSLKVTA